MRYLIILRYSYGAKIVESKAILRGIDGNEITRYGTKMMLVQFGDRTFTIKI